MSRAGLRFGLQAIAALAVCGACAAPVVVSDPEAIRALYRAGRFDDAERAARAYHRAQRRAHGERSVEAAQALDWLVRTCRAAGDEQDPGCLQRGERALAAWEGVVPRDDPRLVPALRQIATIHLKATFRREAVRPLIERILAIREVSFPPPSAEVAEAIGFLGAHLFHQEGNLAGARRQHERALAMLRELPDADRVLRAKLLLDLALVDAAGARFELARELVEQALSGLASSAASPSLVASAHDLRGAILQRQGEFALAARAYGVAEEARLAAGDAGDTELALSWKARAGLAEELGDASAARGLLERALARLSTGQDPQIRPAGFLDRLGEIVDAEAKLAGLELEAGEPEAAERHLASAFARVEGAKIRNPLLLARLHEQRAELYRRRGRATASRGDITRALNLYAGRLRADHPLTARLRLAEGRLEIDAVDFRTAVETIRHAVGVYRGALGADHPALGGALLLSAEALAGADAGDEAFAALEEAARIATAHRLAVVRFLPEGVALRLGGERSAALDGLLEAAASRGRPAEISRVWRALSRVRNAALEAATERRRRADRVELVELAAARRRLAYLHLAPLTDLPFAGRAAVLAEAREEVDRVERRVGMDGPSELATDFEPARSVPPEDALVAFAELGGGAKGANLVAFVIAPGGGPRLVRLGDASELRELVATWRSAVRRAGAGGAAGEASRRSVRVAGEALRRRVWDPVRALVAGAARVWIVPDGVLHFVPFEALPDGEGRFLLESPARFAYLGAERDLADGGGSAPLRRRSGRLLLAGAPRPLPASAPFGDLPGAAAELAEIARFWRGQGVRVDLLAGEAASEAELVRRAPAATTLHLATHSFFAAGEVGRLVLQGEPGESLTAAAGSALAESGIVLAASPRHPDPAIGDGLLSGEEIAALDLDSVELVVLSACDSGAGTPARTEGVVGVRRAFRLAGARSQVVALFPVEDEATRAFMLEMHARLAAGDAPADAVRAAATARLAAARAVGRADDVRSWGAFIAIGRAADAPQAAGRERR